MSQLNFLQVSKVKSRNQKNLLTKKTTTIIGKTEDIDPFNFETETEKTFKSLTEKVEEAIKMLKENKG